MTCLQRNPRIPGAQQVKLCTTGVFSSAAPTQELEVSQLGVVRGRLMLAGRASTWPRVQGEDQARSWAPAPTTLCSLAAQQPLLSHPPSPQLVHQTSEMDQSNLPTPLLRSPGLWLLVGEPDPLVATPHRGRCVRSAPLPSGAWIHTKQDKCES